MSDTNTPAPAWELDRTGTVADIKIGHCWMTVIRNHESSYRASLTWIDTTTWSKSPYPTAPEAARAAVAELRRVLDEARAQLDRVPELEGP